MNSAGFTWAYQGAPPPWEIGRPQPAVVALAEEDGFTGRVLDVACGTGENALHLASRGNPVLGVDGVAAAIERARAKAAERGLDAEFAVADAFRLEALGREFETVLDSAFLHILHDKSARRAYARQLTAVVPVGGRVHLLEISDRFSGDAPKIASADIVDAFTEGWVAADIRETVFEIATGKADAWLVSMHRVA